MNISTLKAFSVRRLNHHHHQFYNIINPYSYHQQQQQQLFSTYQYINRINQIKIKQLGPNSNLLPKSVTFVEENKKTVLHWRLIYFIYIDRFYTKNFINSINDLYSQFGNIPKNILTSCPSQLFDLFKEDYNLQYAIELSQINLTEAPVFARLNDLKFNSLSNNSNIISNNNNSSNNTSSNNSENNDNSNSSNISNNNSNEKIILKKFINRLSNNYSEIVGQILPSENSKFGFKFEKKAEFRQWKEYKEGLFDIQDESSQLIVQELIRNIVMKEIKTLKPLILDYCCGTGGKTFAFAGCLNGKGQIYMHDVRSEKLFPELKRRAQRLGIENIQPIEHDHSHWDKLKDKMNLVLCDVPCTGTGTLRRNVETKYKINYQWLQELTEKQRDIIQKAIPFVKQDGYFLYSTCSILKKENEKQLEWILKKYKNFQLVHTVKILPTIDGSDGMYGVLLKRIN
ncbi:predicted protein [Naegleria gruberi]|uniref:Predicted protein n=1 Tax=Naegleria gruberi TaxID=5762 RepID=D2W356_NAEGR|nr:uncharacterized protein NAEGRDRAFT_75827 [Naegleria gruberi]EFC36521.1 predicted protein [Naegleria gruberi]|eukprot:XP_002669265.1 predicted protein [Naegleria gruberi strain NEG-M]